MKRKKSKKAPKCLNRLKIEKIQVPKEIAHTDITHKWARASKKWQRRKYFCRSELYNDHLYHFLWSSYFLCDNQYTFNVWWLEELIKTKCWPDSGSGWRQGLQGRAEGSRSRCRVCRLGSRGCNTGDPQYFHYFLWFFNNLLTQAINEAASQAAGGDNKNR